MHVPRHNRQNKRLPEDDARGCDYQRQCPNRRQQVFDGAYHIPLAFAEFP